MGTNGLQLFPATSAATSGWVRMVGVPAGGVRCSQSQSTLSSHESKVYGPKHLYQAIRGISQYNRSVFPGESTPRLKEGLGPLPHDLYAWVHHQ